MCPDGYHELLMGDEGPGNATAMADWVKAHCSGAAAAKAAPSPASPTAKL